MPNNLLKILLILLLASPCAFCQNKLVQTIEDYYEEVKRNRFNNRYLVDVLAVNAFKREYLDTILYNRIERYFYNFEDNSKTTLQNIIVVIDKKEYKVHQEFLYDDQQNLILYKDGRLDQKYKYRRLYFQDGILKAWKKGSKPIDIQKMTEAEKEIINYIVKRAAYYKKKVRPEIVRTSFLQEH